MKNFRLLSVILLIGIFLVGCSSGNSSQSSAGGTESKGGNESDEKLSGEITVWAHPYTGDQEVEGKMWDEIISSFEEETGVKVNFEQIPWANRDQKILTALVANNGPDVFYAIPDQMPQYADEGMLLELDPYLEDLDMDDFVDTALVSTTWKDKLYGLPILQEAYTFFYNVDIVKDIGEDPENLPKTWEEFDEWAKKAKDKGYYAMSFAGGGSMNGTLYPYVWQAGGDIVNEDNEVLINNEKSLKAWERLNNMYKEGWIPEDSITAMEHDALWDSGKMLAVQGSGTSVTNLLSKDLFDFVIAPPLKGEEQSDIWDDWDVCSPCKYR